jgi:hypothetical protein
MAINLWKLGGQPTAYNPLPIATQTIIGLTPYQEYIIKFKARSASNARLNISSLVNTSFDFTNELKEYIHPFICGSAGILYVNDINDKGDIIIQDIQLVEKPLPKLTINGVDGFLSGKWSKPPYATFIDDETLQFNVSSNGLSYLDLILEVGQTYSFNCQVDYGKFSVYRLTSGGALNGALMPYRNTPGTFVADTSTVRLFLSSEGANGLMTFKKPMLNLGSIPAPYEKKRGERMVLPVVKKNFYNGVMFHELTVPIVSTLFTMSVKPNETYTLRSLVDNSLGSVNARIRLDLYNSGSFVAFGNANLISPTTKGYSFETITIPPSVNEVRVIAQTNGSFTGKVVFTEIQLEKDTKPTPYQPYAVQMNEKPKKPITPAKKGLVMDGINNYLQLPSMMMDSVEIDVLVNNDGLSRCLIDARVALPNSYIYTKGLVNSDWLTNVWKTVTIDGQLFYDAIPQNKRVKLKAESFSPFTDEVTVMAVSGGGNKTKGTLYGVKCFLNGQVVAEYDFTNPNNIVGDKVLQKAKNLIPSYDSPQWSLHPNFKVLGKDVGRLDASGITHSSDIFLDVKSNTTYLFIMQNNIPSARVIIRKHDDSLTYRANADYQSGSLVTFTTDSTTNKIYARLTNPFSGTFDFIKPQLYELSGREGTLYGNPVSELKAPKRVLYAKR